MLALSTIVTWYETRPVNYDLVLGLFSPVLDRGRVILEGRASEVRKDPRLLHLLAP